jgi:hypothetical protein
MRKELKTNAPIYPQQVRTEVTSTKQEAVSSGEHVAPLEAGRFQLSRVETKVASILSCYCFSGNLQRKNDEQWSRPTLPSLANGKQLCYTVVVKAAVAQTSFLAIDGAMLLSYVRMMRVGPALPERSVLTTISMSLVGLN